MCVRACVWRGMKKNERARARLRERERERERERNASCSILVHMRDFLLTFLHL